MNPAPPNSSRPRSPLVEWLARVNSQVAGWAASASWWRLIVLFVVIMIAASMLGDLLHLKHDTIRVPQPAEAKHRRDRSKESVTVTIGGKEAIRIEPGGSSRAVTPPPVPAVPPVPGASGTDATPPSAAPPSAKPADPDADADEEDDPPTRWTNQRLVTFRGFIGDVGAAILVVLIAYLVGAKIVVRKVAQADAKAQKALDVAEREAVERQLVQARLQVLQAQVEPHFLFNTLAAIDYLIETDPKRASQMQKTLITYLRGALPQMRQESSTLGRELKLIRSYLELIKMRIEDRLEIGLEVPDGLDTAEFPPMMLQSIVENAIQHGIEPKPEGGKVTVSARVANGLLWVEVRDTGVGLTGPVEALDTPRPSGGIGLQNIRERLGMLYSGKARFTLVSDERTGTVVRIGVPYKDATEPAPDAAGPKPEEKTA